MIKFGTAQLAVAFFPDGCRVNRSTVPSSPYAPPSASLYREVGCEYYYEHNTHVLFQGLSPQIILYAARNQRTRRRSGNASSSPPSLLSPAHSGSFQSFRKSETTHGGFDGGREFQVDRSVSSLFRHSVPCDHALRFHPREIFPPAAPFVAGMEGPL